jgi:hypothetical protein
MTPGEEDVTKAPEDVRSEDDADPCWMRPLVSVKSQDRKDI